MKKQFLFLFCAFSFFAHAGPEKIVLQTLKKQFAIGMSASVKNDAEVGAKLAQIFPEVWKYMQENQIKPASAPFAWYTKYEPGVEVAFLAGFMVMNAMKVNAPLIDFSLPAGKAAVTSHLGPYDNIGAAYEALHNFLKMNKLESIGGPWEVYVSDPGTVPSEELQTDIFYPVK